MCAIKILQIIWGKRVYQTGGQIVKRNNIYLFYNFLKSNFVTHKYVTVGKIHCASISWLTQNSESKTIFICSSVLYIQPTYVWPY
jgi:hypothetical protein